MTESAGLDAVRGLNMFAPMSIEEIEERLASINENPCDCGDSLHENALHDLAADDVPWLIAQLRATGLRSTR